MRGARKTLLVLGVLAILVGVAGGVLWFLGRAVTTKKTWSSSGASTGWNIHIVQAPTSGRRLDPAEAWKGVLPA
jgi:hypothetical protein